MIPYTLRCGCVNSYYTDAELQALRAERDAAIAERDVAREMRDDYREALGAKLTALRETTERAERAERERDAMRDMLRDLLASSARGLRELRAEYRAAIARSERAERERDNLRECWDMTCEQIADMCKRMGATEGQIPDAWTLRDRILSWEAELDRLRTVVEAAREAARRLRACNGSVDAISQAWVLDRLEERLDALDEVDT